MDQRGRTLNTSGEVTDDRTQDVSQRRAKGPEGTPCTQAGSFPDSHSAVSKPMPFSLGGEGRLFSSFRSVLEKN